MAERPPQPAPCKSCGRAYAADVLVCPGDGVQLPLEGRLLDGKFQLERRLGHGGMATVWQATNVLVRRPVAIKLMHARYADDDELLARFRNEATAAGRIDSPHICDVLDLGRSPIGPYIVMELLSGCSLSELVRAYQALDPGLAVWIARQALEGLEAAHRVGIVHRDLKPENIHLCRAIRDQWLVKLMDFGISKFKDSHHTGAGTIMGSPNYMAPEQIHGAATVDARADLWSIGVILYEAIAGAQPFARDSIADSLTAVRRLDPPLLHTLAPQAPPGLSEVVARCLRKQPDQRWPSARALSDALAPFERPGPRLRPPTPLPHDLPLAALPRPGGLPRAAEAPVPLASPRALAPAGVAPGGAQLPVPRASSPSGPHRPVAGASGAHFPVARASAPSGPHRPVPAASSLSGPNRAVPGASSPSGPQRPVPAASSPSGPHRAVPGVSSPSGPHRPVSGASASSGAHLPIPRAGAAPQLPAPRAGAGSGPHSPVARTRAASAEPDPEDMSLTPVARPAPRPRPAARVAVAAPLPVVRATRAWMIAAALAVLGATAVVAALALRGGDAPRAASAP